MITCYLCGHVICEHNKLATGEVIKAGEICLCVPCHDDYVRIQELTGSRRKVRKPKTVPHKWVM